MTGVCPLCGATARLGADGTCAYRGGCEHRQHQAEAMGRRIDADVARLAEMVGGVAALRETLMGGPDHPYDVDLATFVHRVTSTHPEGACLHCAIKAN